MQEMDAQEFCRWMAFEEIRDRAVRGKRKKAQSPEEVLHMLQMASG